VDPRRHRQGHPRSAAVAAPLPCRRHRVTTAHGDRQIVLHVTPNANGWQVKQQGSDETEWLVDDKDNAVNHARELAKANQPSQIIIHTRDGRIETEHTYGDDPRQTEG